MIAPDHVAISVRVRAVKERLSAVASDRPGPLPNGWKSFAKRIRVSDQTLRTRLYNNPPTPFSAVELMAICREFAVRADYLLLGRGPMFQSELAESDENERTDRTLSAVLHAHAVSFVQGVTDQDEEWIESILPLPEELLSAAEQGIADSVELSIASCVDERRLAIDSMRLAVAAKVRASAPSAEILDDAFRATPGVLDGRVICLPRASDAPN